MDSRPPSVALPFRTASELLTLVLRPAPLVLTLLYPIVVATRPLRTFLRVQATSCLSCALVYLLLCRGEGRVARWACRLDELHVASTVMASCLYAALLLVSLVGQCLHSIGLVCVSHPTGAVLFLNVLMCVRFRAARERRRPVRPTSPLRAAAPSLVGSGLRVAACLAKRAVHSVFW